FSAELIGRDVDRDADLEAFPGPRRSLARCLAENPASDRDDQPAVLGQWDEFIGFDDASQGMAPADQRLGADHPTAGEIEDRLVEQEELLVLQRGAPVRLE